MCVCVFDPNAEEEKEEEEEEDDEEEEEQRRHALSKEKLLPIVRQRRFYVTQGRAGTAV